MERKPICEENMNIAAKPTWSGILALPFTSFLTFRKFYLTVLKIFLHL